MSQRPSQPLEDLILESLNPRTIPGLPHPLSKFAANGVVKEGPYGDAIIEFIKDSEMGIAAARAAGMASVKVPPPRERRSTDQTTADSSQ